MHLQGSCCCWCCCFSFHNGLAIVASAVLPHLPSLLLLLLLLLFVAADACCCCCRKVHMHPARNLPMPPAAQPVHGQVLVVVGEWELEWQGKKLTRERRSEMEKS
jgi:hypothetical protein